MGVRRAVLVAAFASVVCRPLAAWAQLGQVQVAPFAATAPTPALSVPMLVILAVMLVGGAYFVLRRAAARSSMLAGVVMAAVVAVAYATGAIVDINGAACSEQTNIPFDPNIPTDLRNQCPNPMQVINLIDNCGAGGTDVPETGMAPTQDCTVGTVLDSGEQCHLFTCF